MDLTEESMPRHQSLPTRLVRDLPLGGTLLVRVINWMGDAHSVESLAGTPYCALQEAGFSAPDILKLDQVLCDAGFSGIKDKHLAFSITTAPATFGRGPSLQPPPTQ
jgi:hypothetical protein